VKILKTAQVPDKEIESQQTRLRQPYKAVNKANRKSHMTNKKRYDRRAKNRSFSAGDYVYLYNPARMPGVSRIFHCSWEGPYRIRVKMSDLDYEILGQNDRKFVHINQRITLLSGSRTQDRNGSAG